MARLSEHTAALTMSVEEAAAEMGICVRTAYRLSFMQGFPAIRIGRRIRVSRAGLAEWIRAQEGRVLEL